MLLEQKARETKQKYDSMVAEKKKVALPPQTETDLVEIEILTQGTSNKWASANFCANVFCMLKNVKLPRFSDPEDHLTITVDDELMFISDPAKRQTHYFLGNSSQGMVVVVHKGSMYW